jgi:hypothetical protein
MVCVAVARRGRHMLTAVRQTLHRPANSTRRDLQAARISSRIQSRHTRVTNHAEDANLQTKVNVAQVNVLTDFGCPC